MYPFSDHPHQITFTAITTAFDATALCTWQVITRNSVVGSLLTWSSTGDFRFIRHHCLTLSGRAVTQDSVQTCRKRRGLQKNASIRTDGPQRHAPWGNSVGEGGTEDPDLGVDKPPRYASLIPFRSNVRSQAYLEDSSDNSNNTCGRQITIAHINSVMGRRNVIDSEHKPTSAKTTYGTMPYTSLKADNVHLQRTFMQ